MNAPRAAFGPSRCRVAFVAMVAGAFLCAVALAAMPQLHERLHKITSASLHECAATLVASGACDHFVSTLPACGQPRFQLSHAIDALEYAAPIRARLTSILEHAPPTIS